MFRSISRYCHKLPWIVNTTKSLSVIHDRHFEFFREKPAYKNSVVQLNKDLLQSKVAGPEFSFVVKDHSIQTDSYFTHLMVRDNVMKLTASQVKDLLFLLANIEIDIVKYAKVLKYLDEKCACSIERWPLDLSFYVLDAWFIIWGIKVFHKHYYSAILSLWGRRVNKCSKCQLVLMLYYIGMSKEAPPFLMEAIEGRMEKFVKDFSEEELAVACLSFFKTSKPLESQVLLRHSCEAAKKLLLKQDRFNTIGILKCLRLSKFPCPELFNSLESYVMKDHKDFNFIECINFMAMFASQNTYNESLFGDLEAHALSILKNECEVLKENADLDDFKAHPSQRTRVKDLARFLWTMTSMGHRVKGDTITFLCDMIENRMNLGEFDSLSHVLVDILQSLSIAGFYPETLLSSVLNASTLKKLQHSNRAKPRYQMYFVQRSSQIENSELVLNSIPNLYHPIPKNLDKEIRERKGFKELISILNGIPSLNFRSCYVMPHIMISGVLISTDVENGGNSELNFKTFKKYIDSGIISKDVKDFFESGKSHVCIEILDPSVCINNSSLPLGLMKAKIRQLKILNFSVIPLSSDSILALKPSKFKTIKEFLQLL